MATVEASSSSPISNNKPNSNPSFTPKTQGSVQNAHSECKVETSSITMDNKNTNNKQTGSTESVLEFSKLPPKERRRLKRLVHPSKRKRTAVACDICKRRKQKVIFSTPC